MKLVIEIPNSLYANLKTIKHGSIASSRIFECVKNGTPLTDCTDCVSRSAVIKLLESRYSFDTVMSIYEEVLDLPSVNPTTDLSKIRAEIKSLSDLGILQEVWLCDVLAIIDKYSKGGDSDA